MEIAAPAVLVGKHVAVAGGDGCSRGGNRQLEQRRSEYVAGFAPIEARVRDENFNSADEQGQEAQGGDPVGDADDGRVPRSDCCGQHEPEPEVGAQTESAIAESVSIWLPAVRGLL